LWQLLYQEFLSHEAELIYFLSNHVELEQNLLIIKTLSGENYWTCSLKPDLAELVSWLNQTNTPLWFKLAIQIKRKLGLP
jgi:hypothetical protein